MVRKNYLFLVMIFLVVLSISINFILAAVDWTNFKVFDGQSPPYASNGPGCKFGGSGSGIAYSPGQGCQNGVYDDLGAVWVDMDSNYIAWKIQGMDFSQSKFCNPAGNSTNTIEINFDADNSMATGCNMSAGCMGYPGSEYQLVLNASGNFTTNLQGVSSWVINNSAIAALSVLKNCNLGEIKVAINRSAIVGLSGLNFMVVVKGTGMPIEKLGTFGEDKMMMGGPQDMMSMGMHPCMNVTNQNNCNSSTIISNSTYSCRWDSFMNKCAPNFMQMGGAGMTCTSICGACNSTSLCSSGAKGKCMVVQAPPNMPSSAMSSSSSWTNATGRYMCVEDPTKFMFGGSSSGSCDNDCKYCYSNSTCLSSAYPNPLGVGTGCKWVVDPLFNKAWCDLTTFNETNLNCARDSLNRCLNSSNCNTVGGNWSSSLNLCYANFTGSAEICFDGADNNADGLIDCNDALCLKDPSCGGDINVLTGGFGTLDPMEAMKKSMFGDMDPSPPAMLFSKTANTTLPTILAINKLMIKDMGKSLGVGIGVVSLENKTGPAGLTNVSLLCSGGRGTAKYHYYIDSDANTSSGCNVSIDGINKTGFEYRFEYEIENNGSNGALEIRRGFRCLTNNVDFGLFPAKLAGAPQIAAFGGRSISCMEDVAILAIDKTDLGNPKGNIRIMLATSDNQTAYPLSNDSLLGPGNNGIYYTPGAIDFKPSDCSLNPMACGTAFSVIGGGKFMPFEDCFPTSGDEDLDGSTNCDDSDCMMAPWCSGTDYTTNDKTAPTVVNSKTESFNDFVFIHWTTNEPTNATITFYNSCSNSTAAYTFYDTGGPGTYDDFRPWHDQGIRNGSTDANLNNISISPSTTYYYKLQACDRANNCATSSCLNFTTNASAQTVIYKMDFTPPADPKVNSTVIKLWNGTNYEDINANSAMNKSNYLKDAKLLFNNSANNWSIELEGVDLAQAVNLNLSNTFNVTNQSGKDYVGMNNQNYLEMVQTLGADSVLIQIPGTGTTLMKCNENNLSDCSDVSAQASINQTGTGWVKWKIPSSLGFSNYYVESGASAGNYTLNFTNITASSITVNISQNASFLINVSNADSVARNWTLAIVTNSSNATGFVNGSTSFQVLLGNSTNGNNSYIVRVNVTSTRGGIVSFYINASLTNDSTVSLNSTTDLTLEATFLDYSTPVVHIVSPLNNSYVRLSSSIFFCNITDETAVANLTISIWNSTNTLINSTATHLSSATYALANWSIVLPRDDNYTWNCYGNDSSANRVLNSGSNYSFQYDGTYPLIDFGTGTENSGVNKSQNFTYINITFTEVYFKNITFNLFNSSNNSINSTSYSTAVNVTNFTNLANGVYYYNVTIFDQAGNSNSTATRIITLDTANPASTPNTPANNSYSNSTSQNLTSNITDNLGIKNATVYVYNSSGDLYNQTTTSFASGVVSTTIGTIVNLVQDVYSWFYTLFDWSGNSVTSSNRTLTIDTTYPLISYGVQTENSGVNKSQNWTYVNITLTETNFNNITFNLYNSSRILINSTNYSTATYAVNFTNLIDGTYYYNVTIFDQAGNYNYTTTNSIILDTSAPSLTIRSPANNTAYYANNSIIINFTATDSRTSVSSRWYNYNSTTNVTFSNDVAINYTSTGQKNITFYANDSANNLVTKMYTITINLVNSTTFISNGTSYNVSTNITNIVVPFNSTLQNVTLTNSSQIATIDLTQLLINNTATISSNNLSLATIGTINYTVIIPANTNISSNSNWDGKITLPTVNTSTFTSPTISGGTTSVDTVLEVGSSIELNFTNPVEIIISGKAGKRAAWARGNLTLVNIDTMCNSGNATNTTAPTNINSTARECYTDDGNDLAIWTLHFTQFSAYTYTATAAATTTSSSGGGGSGGGGGAAASYNMTESEFTLGYTKALAKNEKIKFTLDSIAHTITLTAVSASSITVTISSVTQTKTIALGTQVGVDLTSDNINDLTVKYDSYANNKATLIVKKLSTTPITTNPTAPITGGAISEPTSPSITEPTTTESKSSMAIFWIIGIMVVIIAIVIIVFFAMKHNPYETKKRYY